MVQQLPYLLSNLCQLQLYGAIQNEVCVNNYTPA